MATSVLLTAVVAATMAPTGEARLTVDLRTLVDEVVIFAAVPTASPSMTISEPIAEPAVSLWKVTEGLVSDGSDSNDRAIAEQVIARELDRATRSVMTSR